MRAMVQYWLLGFLLFLGSAAVQGQELWRTKEKLARGESVTIVLLGDSMQQSFGVSITDSYAQNFARVMHRHYPNATVRTIFFDPRTKLGGISTCSDPGEDQDATYSLWNEYRQEVLGSGAQVITIIRDGIGGSNVYRLLARVRGDPKLDRLSVAFGGGPGLLKNIPFPLYQNPYIKLESPLRNFAAWSGVVDATIIGIGSNDAINVEDEGSCYLDSWRIGSYKVPSIPHGADVNLRTRYVPLDDSPLGFKNAIKVLADRIKLHQPNIEIAFMTPVGGYVPGLLTNSTIAPYVLAMVEFANNNNYGIINPNRLFYQRNAANVSTTEGASTSPYCSNKWYLGDCLHLNPTGNRALAETVVQSSFGYLNGIWEDGTRGYVFEESYGAAYLLVHLYETALPSSRPIWFTVSSTPDQSSLTFNSAAIGSIPLMGAQIVRYRGAPGPNINSSVSSLIYPNATLTGTITPPPLVQLEPKVVSSGVAMNTTLGGLETAPRLFRRFNFNGGPYAPTLNPETAPEAGFWWTTHVGGRGWGLEAQGNQIYFGGHMFEQNGSGNPTWYFGAVTRNSTTTEYTGALLTVSGGQVLGGPSVLPTIVDPGLGAITFRFANRRNGEYRIGPGAWVPIQRFNVDARFPVAKQ